MNPSDNVLWSYITYTPLALAFERSVEAKIFSELNFQKPILDIGCGDGLFAKLIYDKKIDTGIDPNLRELERARERGGHIELIECYGDKIPKEDGFYNTIFSNSVLEHIPDVELVFDESYRLLAPGGHFYITVPTHLFDKYSLAHQIFISLGINGLANKYSDFFNKFWKHFHFYDPKGWIKIAKNAGFVEDRAFTYNSKKHCLINDFLAPFGLLGLINKKVFNRWIVFPKMRKWIYLPIYFISRRFLKGAEIATDGGLLFLSLKKPK